MTNLRLSLDHDTRGMIEAIVALGERRPRTDPPAPRERLLLAIRQWDQERRKGDPQTAERMLAGILAQLRDLV